MTTEAEPLPGPTAANVDAACARLAGVAEVSPLQRCERLSRATGRPGGRRGRKRDRMAAHGGSQVELIVTGDTYDDAATATATAALADARVSGAVLVPPFDDVRTMAGQVAAMEAHGGTTLSAEVNSALRAEFTKRKRQQALADLLDHLADEGGRLDTAEDEAGIARYVRLLGGRAEEPGELQAG